MTCCGTKALCLPRFLTISCPSLSSNYLRTLLTVVIGMSCPLLISRKLLYVTSPLSRRPYRAMTIASLATTDRERCLLLPALGYYGIGFGALRILWLGLYGFCIWLIRAYLSLLVFGIKVDATLSTVSAGVRTMRNEDVNDRFNNNR